MKKKLLLVVVLLVGCITSPKKTTENKGSELYLLGGSGNDMTDYAEKHFTRLYWIDFKECSLDNKCISPINDSNGVALEYHLWGVGAGIFIPDSTYNSRMKDATFKRLWESNRVPSNFKTLAEIKPNGYTRVFDESPKCLNIEQPTKDTVVLNGSKVILDRVHTPCMPYLVESDLTRIRGVPR